MCLTRNFLLYLIIVFLSYITIAFSTHLKYSLSHHYGDINDIDEESSYENVKFKASVPNAVAGSRYAKQQKNMPRGNRFEGAASVEQESINNLSHQQQHLTERNASLTDYQRHKCRITIPSETLNKYPFARSIEQKNQTILIEICCVGFAAIRWRGNTLCRPQCKNCRNGLCIAPEKCKCYEEFVSNDNGDCVFTCPIDCLNGRCYLDGSCECNIGYKLDESRKFCRPICSRYCGNKSVYNVGNSLLNCTEPEVCSCMKGYTLTERGCQAVCEPECGLGGRCIEPNVCECIHGFTLKEGVCQADCYQKCDNGVCYSQNRCICNKGFTYHQRSTRCVPV